MFRDIVAVVMGTQTPSAIFPSVSEGFLCEERVSSLGRKFSCEGTSLTVSIQGHFAVAVEKTPFSTKVLAAHGGGEVLEGFSILDASPNGKISPSGEYVCRSAAGQIVRIPLFTKGGKA